MPYQLQSSAGILRFTLSGVVTLGEMMSAGREAAQWERDSPVTPHRLTDLTAVADLAVNFVQMDEFAEQRRNARLKNSVRSAIVAPNPAQLGFARMFQILNDNPQIEVRIFPDAPTALAWLQEPA